MVLTKKDFEKLEEKFATKDFLRSELERFATKEDLKAFATKEDLEAFRRVVPTRIEMDDKFDFMNKKFDALRYDVIDKMDAVMGELVTIRQEMHFSVQKDRDQDHALSNHENRITRLEDKVEITT